MSETYTAKEAKTLADAQMATWKGAPDAFLCQVAAVMAEMGAPMFPVDKTNGRSAVWWLHYYSPTLKRLLEVKVSEGKVQTKEMKNFGSGLAHGLGSKMPPAPLPADWVDSPQVVSAAETKAAALGEDREVSLWLPAANDLEADNPPPHPCWAALYMAQWRGDQPREIVYFYINAQSGEVVASE